MHEIFGSEAPLDDVAILTVRFREGLSDAATELAAVRARPILSRNLHTLLVSAPPMLTVRID